ncbi:MAG: nucleotidyltransferase [Poseidonibacter sp.]|uniref:nucleotidyltransferase domain-containing protein n=1 Tax=Poseidonibacter sp. TaxID=2321188 RepID=UPI00359D7B65
MSKTQTNALPMKIVEELTKGLDITDSMFKEAEKKYYAVAKYLGESTNPLLQGADIYLQGSMKLGTVVKPHKKDEFDIDLVILLPNVNSSHNSDMIHKIIGDRLKEDKSPYKDICESKNRCWTINYKSEFHLDITPAISNAFVEAEVFHYTDTAELVPDKKLKEWKDSNPKGLAKWFSDIAKLMPIFVLKRFVSFDSALSVKAINESYTVEDIPDNNEFKGLLRRTIQLLKKHRDYYFIERKEAPEEYKPISILITTLATKSYEKIVFDRVEYNCPFKMMKDIVGQMNLFIKKEDGFKVANPTNEKENFAEKWNDDIEYAKAFGQWQKAAFEELDELQKQSGIDTIGRVLEKSYGKDSSNRVIESFNKEVKDGRDIGKIATGILTASEATVTVKENKFFGVH